MGLVGGYASRKILKNKLTLKLHVFNF